MFKYLLKSIILLVISGIFAQLQAQTYFKNSTSNVIYTAASSAPAVTNWSACNPNQIIQVGSSSGVGYMLWIDGGWFHAPPLPTNCIANQVYTNVLDNGITVSFRVTSNMVVNQMPSSFKSTGTAGGSTIGSADLHWLQDSLSLQPIVQPAPNSTFINGNNEIYCFVYLYSPITVTLPVTWGGLQNANYFLLVDRPPNSGAYVGDGTESYCKGAIFGGTSRTDNITLTLATGSHIIEVDHWGPGFIYQPLLQCVFGAPPNYMYLNNATLEVLSISATNYTPPTIAVVPASSSYTNITSLAININASYSGTPTYVIYNNGLPINTNTTGTFNWTSFHLGTNILWASVLDGYGVTVPSSQNTYVFVTNNPPVVHLNTPTNGFVFNSANLVNVSGTTTNGDGHAVALQVYTNGIYALNANITAGTFSTNVFIAPGTCLINAVAASDGFSIPSNTNSVYSDLLPNGFNITPANGSSFTNTTAVSVQVTANITSSSNYYLYDNSTALGTNTTGTFLWSNLTLGTHKLWSKITDGYGFTAQSQTNTITFVTNNPPVISLNSPTNNSNLSAGIPITITGTTTNGDGHAVTVALYTNGIYANNANVTGGTFSTNLVFSVGTNTLVAVALSDGFSVSNQVDTYCVYVAPNSISISPPTSSYTNVTSLALTTTASYSGPTATYVTYDGSTAINTNSTGYFLWNNIAYAAHNVWVKVIDSYGLPGQSLTNVYTFVTNNPPTVTISTPTNNFIGSVTSTVTISGNATNGDGHAVTLTIFTNGNPCLTMAPTAGHYTTNVLCAPGTNQVYVTATSDGFTLSTFTNQFLIDSYPTLTWQTPTAGLYWWPFSTNWQAYPGDYLGITNDLKIYYFDGAKLMGIGTITNNFTVAYTPTWAYTNHYFYATVTNLVNLATTVADSVTFTNAIPPTVSLSYPTNGSSFTNVTSLSIQALAITNSGAPITAYTFYDGAIPINTNTYGIYTNKSLALGSHSYWVAVIDSNLITAQSSTNMVTIITNNTPSISLLTPTNSFNGTISNAVLITGTATNGDGHAVTVLIYTNNNLAVTSSVSAGRFTNSLTFLAGTNTIYAVGQSDGFTVFTSTNTIYIEGMPLLTWTTPKSGTYPWSLSGNLLAIPSDPLNLISNRLVYYYDGSNYLGSASNSNGFLLGRTNFYTAGSHTLFAAFTNAAGFTTKPINLVTVLTDRPPTSVGLALPYNNSTALMGSVALRAVASDPDNDPITMLFYDGTNAIATNTAVVTTNIVQFTNSVILTNGVHYIHAVAFSTTFAISTVTNAITIISPPVIQWLSPTNTTTQYSTSTMQVNVGGSAPFTVTYTNNGTVLGLSTNALNNYAVTTTNQVAGTNQLVATVTDMYHLTTAATNLLVVNTLYPSVTWLAPTNSVLQGSTNTLQVTATGNPIVQVVYTNNGVYVGTSTTDSNSYATSFITSTAGTNVLIATATDIYGISASSTNLLNVQGLTFTAYFNTPSCISILTPSVITPTVSTSGDTFSTVNYTLDGQAFTGSITNPAAGMAHTIVANCVSVHGLQAFATNSFTATEIATWKLVNLSTHAETQLSRSTCAFYKVNADNRYIITPVYINGSAPSNSILTVLQAPPGWQYASNQTAVQLSTNAGTMVIQVSSSTACGVATYNFDLSGGCITCTTCTDGGTKVANHSVNVRINLGSSTVYGTAGFLEVEQGVPTSALSSPQTLMYNFIRPDVQTVLDGSGNLSQIKVPDGLFTVTTIDANTYSVSFYPSSQVVSSNGVYGATGYPSRVITLGNVGGDTTHFQVNDSDKGIVADYYWLGQGWNMVTGGGIRQENKQEVDTGNQQAITRQILDGSGNVVYQTYEVWADLPSGKNPLLQITGTGSAAKTNSYTYDSNGLLTQENHADGSWAIYQYDSQGRQTDKFSPFLNSAPATDSSGRHETYSYNPANVAGSGDDGTQMPSSPRRTISYVQGQEVSRNYTAYLPNERIDVQSTAPEATWNATGNLVTYTFYSTDVNHYGEVAKKVHPDGTVDTYAWISANGTNQYNEEIHKQGAVDGSGNFTQGTEEDTFTDPATARLVGRMVGDIASGLLTSQEVYSYDEQGHLTNTVHLDNTAEGSSYDCCHLLNTTDKTGLITSYGYDAIDRQVSVSRSGITTSNVLDANGNTLSTYRTGTNGTTQLTSASTYDNAGTLTSSQDALGNTTIYSESVDASGQTVKNTTVLAVTKTQIYAQDGSLLAEIGPTGGTTNVYGTALNGGVLQAYTKNIKLDTNGVPTGEWTQTFTDGVGRTTATVDSDGGSATSSYNALGQLSSQVDGDGATTLYTYNALGQVEFQAVDVNKNGQIDLSGLDRIVQVERDVTAFNGHTVNRTQTYDYPTDNSGAATLISMAAQAVDAQMAWNYSGSGTNTTATTLLGNGATITTQTGADGTVSTTTYQAGQVVSQNTSDAAGTSQSQTFSYDEFNRLAAVTDARNGTTCYTYDVADRVTSVTSPAAGDGSAPQVTTTSYDSYGNPWLTGLPDGSYKTNIYNLDGTLQMSMGSQTYPQAYTYDYAGRVKTLTTWGQAGPAVTTWNYNNRGLLTSKQYADGHGPSYTYTPGGRLATKTSARGIVTTYSYNGGGSLSGVSYSDGEPSLALGYNRLGLVNAVMGNINSILSYNAFGQLLEKDLAGTNYTSQVQYEYDGLNRLQTITSPTLGTTSTIGYTGGRITSVAGNGLTAQYGYINNSPLLSGVIVSGSGGAISASSRQYDNLNRLQSLQTSPSAFGVAYSYNALNQRTARTNNLDSSIWNYRYDGLGQVTAANKTIGSQLASGQQFGYSYDTIGNRLNNTFGGDNTGSNKRQVDYTANTLNQYTQRSYPGYVEVNGIANTSDTLFVGGNNPTWQGNNFWQELGFDNSWSSVQTNIDIWDISATATNYTGYGVLLPKNPETLTYDADGNLTQDSQWTYTWNAENKLVHMQNSSMVLDFVYDLQGRRISKVVTVGGTVTSSKKFYYDGWNLIEEVDSATGIGIAYNWGLDLSQSLQGAGGVSGLISMTISGSTADGTYTYQYDGNGNVIGLVDASGNSAAQYEYGPFGETVVASGYVAGLNSFGFATKSKDVENGLSFYPARPGYPGIWISRDPSEENGGLNAYIFCNNDGVNFVDPAGLALYAFDGTGNFQEQRDSVELLYESYQTKYAWYEKGVGVHSWDILGGGFGAGVSSRIREVWKKFLEYYPHDQTIDIIGFSRGAAEAREFANLLNERGYNPDYQRFYFKNHNTCPVKIRFVGLFDTVGSVGIPGSQLNPGIRMNLPPNVQNAAQALAHDEHRQKFPFTQLNIPGVGQHFQQAIFPGDHSDIGGAWVEKRNELSKAPLEYIWSAGRSAGVPFGPIPTYPFTQGIKPNDNTHAFPYIIDQVLGLNGPRNFTTTWTH